MCFLFLLILQFIKANTHTHTTRFLLATGDYSLTLGLTPLTYGTYTRTHTHTVIALLLKLFWFWLWSFSTHTHKHTHAQKPHSASTLNLHLLSAQPASLSLRVCSSDSFAVPMWKPIFTFYISCGAAVMSNERKLSEIASPQWEGELLLFYYPRLTNFGGKNCGLIKTSKLKASFLIWGNWKCYLGCRFLPILLLQLFKVQYCANVLRYCNFLGLSLLLSYLPLVDAIKQRVKFIKTFWAFGFIKDQYSGVGFRSRR